MKKLAVFWRLSPLFSAMGLLAAAGAANAQQEVGRVISATPVIHQVAVPRQVCSVQPVAAQPSGAGAVIGAIAGGLLGNTVGHGTGRFAATGIGMVAGAAVGNSIENNNAHAQAVQRCATQTTYENRTVAYNVVYEYAGKQYNVQMPHDPGPTIQLQLTPVSANPPPTTAIQGEDGTTWTPQATFVSPVVVDSPMVVYHDYYPRAYYAPVGISLGFGFGGHRHHHRHHRHWR